MEWREEIDTPFESLFYMAAFILFLFSLFTHSMWYMITALILVVINAFTYYYFKHLIKNVRFVNPLQQVRLFAGDNDAFTIELKNDGTLPFYNGMLSFSIDDIIKCEQLERRNFGHKQSNYVLPISVNRHEFKASSIKVKGLKRGIAKFRTVHLTIRDWFGLGEIRLAYDPFIRTEVIVYPELESVYGLDQIETIRQGTRPYMHSLNEDLTSPSGTRNYLSTDPFRHIHWKATAKMGDLQTKVYEKTNGMNWVLMFHMNRDKMTTEEMEREISCMAYVCRYATEHNIPFSIFINIKIRGKGRILHLNSDTGREHLGKGLELLARISVSSLTVNVNEMLGYVNRYRFQNAVMILFHLSYLDDEFGMFRKWQKQGHELYRIEHQADVSSVARLSSKKAVS